MEKGPIPQEKPTPAARFNALWASLRPEVAEDSAEDATAPTLTAGTTKTQMGDHTLVVRTHVEESTEDGIPTQVRVIECMIDEMPFINLRDSGMTPFFTDPDVLESLAALEALQLQPQN